jgi:hypothetical protein
MSGACALSAGVALATGPSQQTTGFWAPYGHTINSVVAISTPTVGGSIMGTGTIIGKRLDPADPTFGWLCVLTANHVVDPFDPSNFFTGPSTIIIGSNFNTPVEGPYGGATNVLRFGQRPVAQGGLGGVDIALLGVRVPANSPAFTLITPATMLPVNPQSLIGTQFSQIGFGGTGNYVDGGMQGAGNPGWDGQRRFQGNMFTEMVPVNTGNYNYTAIRWYMNNVPGGGLQTEGLSYGGDSGGPYFINQQVFTHIPPFQRRFPDPNDPNDPDLPDWPGGLMPFFSNGLVGVHTRGNSLFDGFSPYNTSWGAGVPLLRAYVDWIDAHCRQIPTPSSVVVLFTATLVALRRRRAA